VNSLRRVVRRGVHQLFDLMDGRDWGGVVSIAAVSEERAEENHWSGCPRKGGGGGRDEPVF